MPQWLIDEQVEDAKSITQSVAALRMTGDNRSAVFLLQRDLDTREIEASASDASEATDTKGTFRWQRTQARVRQWLRLTDTRRLGPSRIAIGGRIS
jgi:hypothetical protein